jgi:hypothetical protein
MKLYHCTDAGDELEREGFLDSFLAEPKHGVFLSDRPAQIGMFTIEVDVPDDLAAAYLADARTREWCIPAEVLNIMPRRRVID